MDSWDVFLRNFDTQVSTSNHYAISVFIDFAHGFARIHGADGVLKYHLNIAAERFTLAIEMALNGLGVVMGRKTLIQPLLDAGRLVALSENEAPSPFGYDLICPQENRSRPRFRAFSEWLAEECA